jgi:hypothetical protein
MGSEQNFKEFNVHKAYKIISAGLAQYYFMIFCPVIEWVNYSFFKIFNDALVQAID